MHARLHVLKQRILLTPGLRIFPLVPPDIHPFCAGQRIQLGKPNSQRTVSGTNIKNCSLSIPRDTIEQHLTYLRLEMPALIGKQEIDSNKIEGHAEEQPT